ncbi:PP2C family serine/threonine-protein phosphatase [Massilia sp. MS-15]|uniref:PP2C family serine/threonine-protein phosphatase n=1 Tax=Massilia sp. MS-15 TaxID=2878200 RepID=UPI001CD34176|nr:PP2C family serine/threonine-protein phosphatase [Massilia sp. MS-15]MCA1246116.1 protein phosphatase 2C domain-containing protein [Massilia sp. MS-15]
MAAYAYVGQHAASFDAGHWRSLAVSVTGPYHQRHDLSCEDAAGAATDGRWLVAMVCDGAGSAQEARRGAELVAQRVPAGLLQAAVESKGRRIRTLVRQQLDAARRELSHTAEAAELPISAFATTVVGLVARGSHAVLFQIGDGAAVAFADSGTPCAVLAAAEQEYANETYFLTDHSWNDSLRFMAVRTLRACLLMSDGVTPFALESGGIKRSFVDPVLACLDRHPAGPAGEALKRLLSSEQAGRQVGDDKTLLWASLAAGHDDSPP